jgi:hypothetical protein
MDSIDITDSAFSLEIPGVNNIIHTGGNLTDNTMFIYIGAAILVAFIGMFVYKFYMNKRTENANKNLDCEGGFCNMNDRPTTISHI